MRSKKILAAAIAVMMVAGAATILPADLSGKIEVASASPVIPPSDDIDISEWIFADLPDGTVEAASYRGSREVVIVPTEYNGKKVTRVGEQCFTCTTGNIGVPSWNNAGRNDGNENIVKVIVPEGIKSIEMLAFDTCPKLEEVVLPSTLESLGSGSELGAVFDCCYALTKVTGLKDTKIQKIEMGTFSECTSLKKIELPPTVTEFEDIAFMDCTSLEEINIGNVTKFGMGAMQGCKSLHEDKLGLTYLTGYDTLPDGGVPALPDNIEHVYDAAFRDTGIKNIVIPKTLSQADIGEMAFGFKILEDKSCVVDDDFTAYVWNHSGALEYCKANNVNYVIIDPDEDDSSKADDDSSKADEDSKADESTADDSKGDDESDPNKGDDDDSRKGEDESDPDKGDDDSGKDDTDRYWKLGDVNGDGTIDIADVSMLMNHINGVKALDKYQMLRADVDKNTSYDIIDATTILNHINGVKAIEGKIRIPDDFPDDYKA